jgi:hypothetical protein
MLVFALVALIGMVAASSHSEAPGTAKGPRSDIVDLYAFQAATATGAAPRTTLIMNGNGLARSDAGPNYSPVDTNFVYQINVDNDGDAREDISFQFIFGQRFGTFGGPQASGAALTIGGVPVKIPLVVFKPD